MTIQMELAYQNKLIRKRSGPLHMHLLFCFSMQDITSTLLHLCQYPLYNYGVNQYYMYVNGGNHDFT